jgi:rhodanese-related sulfurtransferase
VTSRRAFAATALALGAAAPFAGSPYLSRRSDLDAEELARIIDGGGDHVDAVELAEWIMQHRPRLRVIDLRAREAFEAGSIPTAESFTLDELLRAEFQSDETLVLYSEGGAHAGQAWVLLRALGHGAVFFLRSGAYEWADAVLNPALPVDPTVAERAAFERALRLSSYFGGTPRRDVPRAEYVRAVAALRRRGC